MLSVYAAWTHDTHEDEVSAIRCAMYGEPADGTEGDIEFQTNAQPAEQARAASFEARIETADPTFLPIARSSSSRHGRTPIV